VPTKMQLAHNTPDKWKDYLSSAGRDLTFHGDSFGSEESYFESGANEWGVVSRYIPDKLRVVEWGCGDGRLSLAACKDCEELYCYDSCEEVRNSWCKNVFAHSAYIINNLEELAQLAQGFTGLFCWNVMHHMDYDNIYELIDFCDKNIADNGTIVVNYQNFNEHGVDLYKEKPSWGMPIYIWSSCQIRSMFSVYGFKLLEFDDSKGRILDSFGRKR
jgi:2-polyprenyl-3-methyl-5-hydroxy-6-metoxy-1,4-benzoquinol methylase